MLHPGTLFCCRPNESSSKGLYRTASTYGYGERLETQPNPKTIYVICKDGSVQSVLDLNRPIGWEVGDGWYRLTQTGFGRKPCHIKVIGHATDIPAGRGFIGSQVYYREVAFEAASQNAQVIGGEDEEDEDEVTSR